VVVVQEVQPFVCGDIVSFCGNNKRAPETGGGGGGILGTFIVYARHY